MDAIGNRNNLLSVPITEEVTEKSEQPKETSERHTVGNTLESTAAAMTGEKLMEPEGLKRTSNMLEQSFEPLSVPKKAEITKESNSLDESPQIPLAAETVVPTSTPKEEEAAKNSSAVDGVSQTSPVEDTAQPTSNMETADDDEVEKGSDAVSTEKPPIPVPVAGIEEHSVEPEAMKEKDSQSSVDDTKPAGNASSPTVVLEKTDSAPRYGDDFGEGATFAQKEAHHLRAQDAEPDYVVVRNQSRTPELANVAAEVADTAATLDRDAPTPPIPNEEAGRIGLRRMSETPIPEVANTAAEVADVAAALDQETGPGTLVPETATTTAEVTDSATSLDKETAVCLYIISH